MHKFASLTPKLRHILLEKGTEMPFSSEYHDDNKKGSYLCRACGAALYRGSAKFSSQCGWPSWDQEITGAVKQQLDVDGRRMEIVCAKCGSHLGHIFMGEGYTALNTRHCVNSLALDFVNSETILDSEEAIVSGGCFWGMQYLLNKLVGVVKTEVGYIGGHKNSPTYEEVCQNKTGHFEATRIIYDKALLDYQSLIRYFLEIHDPTQVDGQGSDIGSSYKSAIFYYDEKQKETAHIFLDELRLYGYQVVTELRPVTVFWKAESYHQEYYIKNEKTPYCHHYVKRFPESINKNS